MQIGAWKEGILPTIPGYFKIGNASCCAVSDPSLFCVISVSLSNLIERGFINKSNKKIVASS